MAWTCLKFVNLAISWRPNSQYTTKSLELQVRVKGRNLIKKCCQSLLPWSKYKVTYERRKKANGSSNVFYNIYTQIYSDIYNALLHRSGFMLQSHNKAIKSWWLFGGKLFWVLNFSLVFVYTVSMIIGKTYKFSLS